MYRIVPVKSPSWLLAVAPVAVLVAAAAFGYAVWVAATTKPADRDSWQFFFSFIMIWVGIISLIGGFVAAFLTFDGYRNGRQIIFDDQLTIHYPWPMQSRVYPWSEIARIEAIDEKIVVREPTSWVPLPIDGIIPGASVVVSLHTYQERTLTVRKFNIIHVNGRKLAEISSHTKLTFDIVRWMCRKTLFDLVGALGGSIAWKGDAPQSLSLRGSRLSSEQWKLVKEQITNVSGLQEIDLSGTPLTDADLAGLDALPALRSVKADHTRISPKKVQHLNTALAQRSSAGKFDFLPR